MAVNIDIKHAEHSVDIKIKDKATRTPDTVVAKFPVKLNIRRTIDGEIIILDHPEIDITISPSTNKIMVFAKDYIDDNTYYICNDFLKFLDGKKIIKPETIRSGNIYGSLEAEMREPKSLHMDALQLTLLSINDFMQDEKKFMDTSKRVADEFHKRLYDPDEEHSTELGEIPHKEAKGSIRPGLIRRYGQGFYYIYENKEK